MSITETVQKLKRTDSSTIEERVDSSLFKGLSEKLALMIIALEHSGIQIIIDFVNSKLIDMEKTGSSSNGAFGEPTEPTEI